MENLVMAAETANTTQRQRDFESREAPAITLEGIQKKFGYSSVLCNIELHVMRGEFVTLLGPSGSGKSTILNVISGVTLPTAGKVFLDGQDVTKIPVNQRNLGIVLQNYALMPHMNIFENIAFPLRIRRISANDIQERVSKVIELVKLSGFEKRKPRELSGGQQQRVAIARCLSYSPSTILMDEPLGALDKNMRTEMQYEIMELHKALGFSIVYVTHDQEEALLMSDKICIVKDGHIEQEGLGNDLYFHPQSEFVATFLGESNIFKGITHTAGGGLRLECGDGLSIQADSKAFLPEMVSASALVRPECIRRLAESDVADNELIGHAKDVAFIGGVTKYTVTSEQGQEIVVRSSSFDPSLQNLTGEQIRIGWNRKDTVIIRL
jgi:putative spermidine/putrescine transport system ATP-binding protein